jgi:hypothetical protein
MNGMKACRVSGLQPPLYYYFILEDERSARCKLTTDTCIVDGEYYFVRGCLEISVRGADEPFIWGVWVSLSEGNFEQFVSLLGCKDRSKYGPYFGWLWPTSSVIPLPRTSKRRSICAMMGYAH